MGSTLKFDSDRRELVRERRNARIERNQQRREARAHKRSQTAETLFKPSAVQQLAEREVQTAVERIDAEALDRHEEMAPAPACSAGSSPAPRAVQSNPAEARPLSMARIGEAEPRQSRRERDLVAFRRRRQQTLAEARTEARERIDRAGELASVTDALAAIEHPEAGPWRAEREQLETAIATGRIVEVGATARRAAWAISRDAARTSRRARRDPDLALALCVAYAVITRLPRTALRSAQRSCPTPQARRDRRRAFWR
ncbi:MAG: hypothetical protein ACYCXW_06715 [Solirubrobacteraceae bacterium]